MQTITKNQFRGLLTLSILALVASVIAGVFDSWLLPPLLLDYSKSQHSLSPNARDIVIGLLGIPGVIAGIVAIVGLYRFWPSAPWLSVAAWLYMLLWMPFSLGPVVTNALAGALSQCSTLLAGAVLAIVFFSPAAGWFQKKEVNHAT